MTARTAIVVEGGAMRGVFSVGVLDVFLESGFDPFDLAIGVSAGACNLASHLAGQEGRNRRSYLGWMRQRDFIDVRRLLSRRSVVDLDWLWAELAEHEPLDVSTLMDRKTEFVIVATSADTGQPVYLQPTADDVFDALRASCALPMLYRGPVTVGSERLIDGGVSDPIPAEEAYRRGARRIVVIRSRPANVVKRNGLGTRLNAFLMRAEPAVADAVRETAERYQRAVAFMTAPPADCEIVQVAPPHPLATKRTTRDRRALESDYALGRQAGEDVVRSWE